MTVDEPAEQPDVEQPAKDLPAFEKITEPGVYDIPAEHYHADPVEGGSLSSTGARRLLPPSCPAMFRHLQLHPQPHKKTFDYGTAAHSLVLGAGRGIAVVDADSWRTNKAKAAKAEAYDEGQTPLLTKDYAVVEAMANALRAHQYASRLLNPETGKPEQTLVWRDQRTGVNRRAMLDWLPNPVTGRRLIVADYKTCVSADPDELRKALANFHLHQQGAWNLDGIRALDLSGEYEPAFVLIFQEKTEPYLVTVAQIDPTALLWGSRLNDEALTVYARCQAEDHWPGYAEDVISLELPVWVTRELEDAYDNGLPLTPYADKDAA